MNQENLKSNVRDILTLLGENAGREGLVETPRRVAQSLKDLTSGYGLTASDVVQNAIFEAPSQGLVMQKNIEFYSLCEHHLLPFFGRVHVAYVPKDKVIGLSKIGRIVDVFAKRLQLQERLTEEIANSLQKLLEPKSLLVILEASHFCMMMRGVQKQFGTTTTLAARGEIQDNPALRRELMELLKTDSFGG